MQVQCDVVSHYIIQYTFLILFNNAQPLDKKSDEIAITRDSGDVPDGECIDECEEDEEVKSNIESMNRLQVSVSARERRRSIENLFRPPTPPNACHSVKE